MGVKSRTAKQPLQQCAAERDGMQQTNITGVSNVRVKLHIVRSFECTGSCVRMHARQW